MSVENPQQAARLWEEAGQWRVMGRGEVDRAELTYWRLPQTAAAEWLKICPPSGETGCIRFVRFRGVDQRPVRLAARPWDTGGIFSIMVRSDNVQALFNRALRLGWWAESEPIAFSFGGSQLRNVVLQGPHGINLAVYERASPPFTAFPLGAISQGFNAMRMVRDQRASLSFYRDKLGFSVVFDADYRDPVPQPSNFSLPQNLTTTVVRRAAALQPMDGETGRVEVMEFVGLKGRDFSSFAVPPNLGILSLRYPVQDVDGYRKQLESRGVSVPYSARSVSVGGLGTVNLFAVRDPDGSITEFYEP